MGKRTREPGHQQWRFTGSIDSNGRLDFSPIRTGTCLMDAVNLIHRPAFPRSTPSKSLRSTNESEYLLNPDEFSS